MNEWKTFLVWMVPDDGPDAGPGGDDDDDDDGGRGGPGSGAGDRDDGPDA